jgi:hypothetical protein
MEFVGQGSALSQRVPVETSDFPTFQSECGNSISVKSRGYAAGTDYAGRLSSEDVL